MTRTPKEKFLLLFEALKRSLLASEMLYGRLKSELGSLESDMDEGKQISERAATPLLSAVAFVDFAHRFGSLADSLPLINKRKPQIKQLRSALISTESARNHLQHMRGDLSSNDPIEYPLLGSLSWIKGHRCFLISFGQATEMNNLFSIAFDATKMQWTTTYQYQVKDTTISLDAVMQEMRAFYAWLTSAVTFADPELAELKWGNTLAVAFSLEMNMLTPGTSP